MGEGRNKVGYCPLEVRKRSRSEMGDGKIRLLDRVRERENKVALD